MERLEALLRKNRDRGAEYTLNHLVDLVKPRSREELAILLGELVREGDLKQVIRVYSRKIPGGIGDYESLKDIPRFIRDWRTDTEMEVSPEDLKVIYVLPAHDTA